QAASLDPDDRVCLRIEGRAPAEHFDTDDRFLDCVGVTVERRLHHEAQKLACALGVAEGCARQNPVKLCARSISVHRGWPSARTLTDAARLRWFARKTLQSPFKSYSRTARGRPEQLSVVGADSDAVRQIDHITAEHHQRVLLAGPVFTGGTLKILN